ncbi:MAG: hypothetical protein IKO57_01255 [Treponema sp.]|nr:hypothetical protein [Treponema sp.]
MTLRIRNQFLKIFTFFSITWVSITSLLLIKSIISKQMMQPPTDIRTFPFPWANFFTECRFSAIVCSILILLFFAIGTTFFVTRHLKKTQSSELIFFFGFLIGVLCEAFRLLIITFGLWLTFSDTLLALGKMILFGRTIAALSFFFAALLGEPGKRNEIEQNFVILVAISALISAITPLNTIRITSTGMVTICFPKMISTFKAIVVIISTFAFIYNSKRDEKPAFNWVAINYLILFFGYELLINSDCIITMVAGAFSLLAGTAQYLMALHKIYLWN